MPAGGISSGQQCASGIALGRRPDSPVESTCSVQLVALLGTESAGEHSTENFVPPALGRRPLELDRKNGTWVTVIAWVL